MPHAPVRPTSTWWRDAAPDTAEHPPLLERTDAEVVVIGAGIVGVTLATDLAIAGRDVVLLESGRVGSGATGHTSAKATALQSPRYARMQREHGAEAARAYARFSLDAVERIGKQAGNIDGADPVVEPALTWTHRDADVDQLEAEARAAIAAGLAVRTVTDHDRFDLRLGLELADQLRFQPLAYLRGLLATGVAAGLRVHEASPVTAVSLTGSRRTVTTERGGVTAPHVVVATGLPVLDRGGWFARMEPKRSYVVVQRCDQPPAELALRIGDETRSSRAVTGADGEPLLLVAGAGHRVGQGGDTRRHPAALAAWGQDVFGAGEVVASWAAQDWEPVDGLPMVGPLVPGDDRVLAAGGFDKWGLTSGTAAAAALVRRLLGQPATAEDQVLDPARLPGAKGARKFASTNATVGWEMTTGWLRAVRSGPSVPPEGQGVVARGSTGVRPVATSTVDGTTRSCSAVCTHLGGVVTWDAEERSWSCALHGSRFDTDGRVQAGPATRPLAPADA